MPEYEAGSEGGVLGASNGFETASPVSGQYGSAAQIPGVVGRALEPFCDPNSKPFRLSIPAMGGNQGFVQIRLVLGSWGATVFKVYASMDGVIPIVSTVLATINTTDRSASFPCTSPWFVIDLDTAHGSTGSLVRVDGATLKV